MIDPPRCIEEVYESSARPLAALIGSGLSIPSPTSLPSCREMIKSLVVLDWVSGPERFPLPEEILDGPAGSSLLSIRLEHALSVFVEWKKHDLALLLRQFADAPPNIYQRAIAELCNRGIIGAILTTNFDQCIEKAFDEFSLEYRTVVRAEDRLKGLKSTVPIFKIHGSISKSEVGYEAIELGATIQSIHRRLVSWKEELLREMLNHYTIVVLGYGGGDSYDINPVLLAHPDLHIVWVAHTSRERQTEVPPEVGKILGKSSYPKAIFINTGDFIGCSIVQDERSPSRLVESYDLEKHFHPSIIVGRLLEEVREYEAAYEYYMHVLAHSTGSYYWMTEIIELGRRSALCLYELGRYEDARETLAVWKMQLLRYINRVHNDGRTPAEFMRTVVLDQALLFSEEDAFIEAELGNRTGALDRIGEAFLYARASELPPEDYLDVESRLRLNRAAIRMIVLWRTGEVRPGDALLAKYDILRAIQLKREVGDGIGLLPAFLTITHIFLCLGQLEGAKAAFSLCLEEALKLATPLGSKVWPLLSENGAMLAFATLEARGAKSTMAFLQIPYDKRALFASAIENCIRRMPPSDAMHALDRIVKDQEIRAFVSSHGQISKIEHGTNITPDLVVQCDPLDRYKLVLGNLGIQVIGPMDKIASYIEGILQLGEEPEADALKADNWDATGDQYQKAGDVGCAILAYREAILCMQRASLVPGIPKEVIQTRVDQIRSKLDPIETEAFES